MKRLMTLLMAAVLVVMAAVNFNVQPASAQPSPEVCQQFITTRPYLKDNPGFIKYCGSYINTTPIKIVDIRDVGQCTYEAGNDPQAKEGRRFMAECSDALKTATKCRDLLAATTQKDFYSILEQLDPTVNSYEFQDYCNKLDRYGILERNF